MHPLEEYYLDLTRRRFFGAAATSIGAGLGGMALASLLGAGPEPRPAANSGPGVPPAGPGPSGLGLPPAGPHFPARAKRVIYMHMEGAPSQLDLFDYKPGLRHRFDQDLPDSI